MGRNKVYAPYLKMVGDPQQGYTDGWWDQNLRSWGQAVDVKVHDVCQDEVRSTCDDDVLEKWCCLELWQLDAGGQ